MYKATLRSQVTVQDSMNMNLSTSEPNFGFQISQPPNIGQKWVCIQNLQMDLSFQEKKRCATSIHGLQVTAILVIQENSDVFLFACPSYLKVSDQLTGLFSNICTLYI